MKVGLIGLGMVADQHVAAIRGAGLTLGPVMGRNFERAEAFAARHEATAVRDVNAVAKNSDFVILITPPNARQDITQQLVNTNTPILAEKPLERDLPRARALVEMCEAANVPFGVTLQYRMRPSAHRLTELLPKLGRIGTVELRVPWWRDQAYYDTLGRGTYERDGGGVLLTQAIHPIDLMLQFTGPVAAVQAMTATALHKMEAEDFAAASIRFASGATGSLVASVTHFPGGTDMLVLNGTKGSAVLSGDELTFHPRDGAAETVGARGETGGGADPMAFSHALHQGVIADFADSLREGRAPFITGRSALAVHALIDAIQDSGRRGVLVDVAQ